jgi:hypothetical protein
MQKKTKRKGKQSFRILEAIHLLKKEGVLDRIVEDTLILAIDELAPTFQTLLLSKAKEKMDELSSHSLDIHPLKDEEGTDETTT